MKGIAKILTLAGAVSAAMAVDAEVKLPQFFTDGMVMQRNSVLTINGKADGAVEVSASWLAAPVTAETASDGSFSVRLTTPEAGGPYNIAFTDKDGSRTLSDVWSGEVWLCSGQSNMEMPVGGWGKVKDYEKEISNATHPPVHLLQIKKATAFTPQDDAAVNMGGWRHCSPETVAEFSSIAYFFARELNRQLGVHVGVIDATWGGTPAEAWTSLGGVQATPGFEKETEMLVSSKGDNAKMQKLNDERMAAWYRDVVGYKGKFNHKKYSATADSMTLPAFVETKYEDFNGVVVFQRYLDVPASLAGKDLTLRLAKIDDEDVTYFNGKEVGRTSGYDTPRTYTVPGKLVKAGKNLISIEVTDFEGGGGIYGDASDLWAQSGDVRLPLSGEWGCEILADFRGKAPRPASCGGSSFPTVLYNAMFHPLKDIPVKGVIWYQGCANVGRDAQYAELIQNMVKSWRETRNQPDMPFYFMQLAGYLQPKEIQPESEWAALREAQTAACRLPGVKYATAIDIGNPDDIHPKNKQEAARRFALIALNDAYGMKEVKAYGPEMVEVRSQSDEVRGKSEVRGQSDEVLVKFNEAVTVDGIVPAGFIVRLSDGNWVRPEIRMEGMGNVFLTAPGKIEEVRYDWADYPDGNLHGLTGLPVAPFKKEVSK